MLSHFKAASINTGHAASVQVTFLKLHNMALQIGIISAGSMGAAVGQQMYASFIR